MEVVDMLPGDEAGLKNCTLSIKGPNAYGQLKSEMGTHRLVRMSPFNADGKRQTSFAAVEITPEMDEVADIKIDEKELRIDTYRASGAGGQHVNKTDSAVRITHVPTGLFVACQNERSQVQNKSRAMKMLGAKLQQLKDMERLDELKDLKGERGTIGWGHQIRSYFLQPTQMVKDLRTRHGTSQAYQVLDGDIQPFIDAYLRWRLGGSKDMKGASDDDE
jgi:peptide chain release factor 2